MPRHQPVHYPQVARPSAQSYLAPAQHDNRFSWQGAATEEGGQTEHTDGSIVRASTVPPLPVLPDTLPGGQQQVQQPQAVYHQSQPGESGQQDLQQQYFIQNAPQQVYGQPQTQQFRPDIPRNLQQYHQQPHFQQQEQTLQQPQQPHILIQAPSVPTYEDSQAAHHTIQHHPGSMQEQDEFHADQPQPPQQFSSHAQYVQHQRTTEAPDFQSSEEKPEPTEPHKSTSRREIGPDTNPLSPRSPTSPTSPKNTNIQSYPPMSMNYQTTPYEQYNSSSGGTWHHGLGSCSEPTTCFSSLFCPCIVYGRTQYKLSLKSAKKDPTNMLGYSFINGPCLAWSLLCGVNIVMTAFQHRVIRKSYQMDETAGNAVNDCITSTCCCCCVIAQGEKEVIIREEKGRVADKGYTSPTGMSFAPHS